VPLPTRVDHLPLLPVAYARALDDALAELGLIIDADARRAIDDHVRLLRAWNETINLSAIREPEAIARLHVADSLTAVSTLRARDIDSFVDIGSGAGYPGIPIAAAMPASRALVVDSVAKKTAFLETVVRATGLAPRVAVAPSRAETLATKRDHRASWSAVTSRAVGSVAETVELGFPLLRVGGIAVMWKRRAPADEIDAGRRAAEELGDGALEIVPVDVRGLDDHVLVIATKSAATPRKYPRDPAERRRRPW
jgi:16S rRNA (guanine527-N7)-methyltransferase